ncbi:hypothetical protein GQ55_1G177400 [Panicum hallii var. hallii]|uniref:Uncharacterized protein n=1 Tax=Panicum hallii var. hallii TaxID=1504633 RepID=A0A2T7F5Z1_9POAL|nr:hypothetical protein GQ55_1G177400 [Panicum hallii var. hallii]
MMAYNYDRLLTFQVFMLLPSTDSIYARFMVYISFSWGESLASPTIEGVWCHHILFVFY